jgi:hypothetical protein
MKMLHASERTRRLCLLEPPKNAFTPDAVHSSGALEEIGQVERVGRMSDHAHSRVPQSLHMILSPGDVQCTSCTCV